MKQVKFLAMTLGLVVASMLGAHAQKIGYVDAEGLIFSLPEIQKVQQDLQKYQNDSIGARFEALSAEYKEKDSIFKDPKTAASVKNLLQKDLAALVDQLQNWQQYGGQMNQAKQAQLMQPLNKKVMDAINAVAKEKGYAYVLNPEALMVAPPGDDITIAVAQKLGIKIPPANAPATGAGAGTTAPASTAPKK